MKVSYIALAGIALMPVYVFCVGEFPQLPKPDFTNMDKGGNHFTKNRFLVCPRPPKKSNDNNNISSLLKARRLYLDKSALLKDPKKICNHTSFFGDPNK